MRHRVYALCTLLLVGSALLAWAPSSGARTAAGPAQAPQAAAGASDATKVWVFFKDKGFADDAALQRAVADLASNYNPRAVERRRLRGDNAARGGSLFDARDLPVCREYVAAAQRCGAQVHVRSRWLNAVSARVTPETAQRLASLPFVDRVEPVRRARRIEPADRVELDAPAAGRDTRSVDYGLALGQLRQINLLPVHDMGFTGAGVVVGILDTGFRRTHSAFNDPQHPLNIIAEWDFINNDPNAGIEPGDHPDQHVHGTLILGCLGAYKPGSIIGGAYDAAFILCKTEDVADEYPAEEDNYVAGLEFIEFHGGDMATSSLGYIDWYTQGQLDGQTAVTTIAVNIATSNGMHCCTAAGNSGHDANPMTSHLIAPADAFQVLACGAADASGTIAGFSSDGPSADGRVKPEVLAQGVTTVTVSAWNDNNLSTASGTSLSTPVVACAVACLTQAHPEWTVDQMRTALFSTARDQVANGTHDPLYVRGYGVIDAFGAIQDCNANDIPDILEIAGGTEPDCQGNGVIDACETGPGSGGDCNGNGVPDACDVAFPLLELVDTQPAVVGWYEIAGVGTPLNLANNGEAALTLPFTNALFTSSALRVGNDGAVGFEGPLYLPPDNLAIPTFAAFGGGFVLFPFWDDLDNDTGNVYWHVAGTAPNRVFIVQWDDLPHTPGDDVLDGDEVTFQVQLFEAPAGGVYAQFLYEDTDFQDANLDAGRSASVGFQLDGRRGAQWSYNQPVILPGLVLSLVAGGTPTSVDANGNGVPDECEGLKGDMDCDDDVDFDDIDPFVAALEGRAVYEAQYPGCNWLNADCNQDGRVDFDDIDPFVALLAGSR